MRVLLLCTHQTTYVVQLFRYVRKYYPDVRYSVLTYEASVDYYRRNLELRDGEEVYSLLGPHLYLIGIAISRLPKFDIIHSLWFEYYWGCFAGTINRKCDHWFASIGGSDLYRQTKQWQYRALQRRILRRCELISSEGEKTRDYFNHVYNDKYVDIPHRIIRFGVDILDELVKIRNNGENKADVRRKYGIPFDKTVVMCGTSGRQAHQHIKMLEAIEKIPSEKINELCLLVPMTFDGTEEYIKTVEQKAKSVASSVVILRDYLSPLGMAEIAFSCDIMVHVQTTDQLSSTMLSHMYNGNVVIAGSWLPYEELRDKGIGFISIDSIDDLTEVIPTVLNNLDGYRSKFLGNDKLVYEMSSWEKSARDWYDAYTFLMEKEK